MDMNANQFNIRPYAVRELAMMYFPSTDNPDTAVAHLRRWLRRNAEAQERLWEAGYMRYAKYLTSRQVGIIVDVFGEP